MLKLAHSLGNKAPSWAAVLFFTLLIAPFALQFQLHYPDEMYYSNAAVKMLQNGDYLTTYLGNGELRFKKPILTYWWVLAGFKLFGLSAFSSRIFFLLAGSALVFLVYKIGRLIDPNKKVAYLASWIAASHPVLIFSSTRSIPDILLALFMTLCGLGCAGLLKYGSDAPKKYLWMFYLGIAFAFEAKGLPAAALGGIALIYLAINPWKPIHWKKLLYIPAITACILIGLFWFYSMYLKFGSTYLDSFFHDQVGMRVGSKFLLVFKNFALATLLMVAFWFPWIIPVIQSRKKTNLRKSNSTKPFLVFAGIWALSIIVMSALVFKFYERYLLPATPVATVALAWLIFQNEDYLKSKGFRIINIVLLIINTIVFLLAVFLHIGLGSGNGWIYLGLALGLIILASLFTILKSSGDPATSMGMTILLTFYLMAFMIHPISLPGPGEQFARFVKKEELQKGTKVAFVGHLHVGSKIRIGLGKKLDMKDLPQTDFLPELKEFDYLICEDKYRELLPESEFQLEVASVNWDPKLIPEMLRAILEGNTEEQKNNLGKKYYWGTRME